jgi:hypothetical protein
MFVNDMVEMIAQANMDIGLEGEQHSEASSRQSRATPPRSAFLSSPEMPIA